VQGDPSTGIQTPSSVDITVVVCTYNRSRNVEQALPHICQAAARVKASVEIIVVDNNSQDETKSVVESASRDLPFQVRYLFERTQGLSFARNRGIRESKGAVIAFTDDDCIVDADWVAALWREFASNPDVGVIGGRVDLFTTEDRPVTIRTVNERVRYSNLGQIYGLIVGCNLAVRREVADQIGGFDPAFGGSKGVYADDIDFVYRALRSGVGVLYAPELRVFHNHGRRTDADVRLLGRGYAKGRGAFFCKYLLKADPVIARHAWWEVRAQLSSIRAADNPEAGGTIGALASGALHFILTRSRLWRY
jgi:GT2 family glycosyltransferase